MKLASFVLAVLGVAIGADALACDVASQKSLYDDVAAHAEETKVPAVVARSVILVTSDDGRCYDPATPLMWTARPGLNLLHLPADRLSAVDRLAGENLGVIRETMKKAGWRAEGVRLKGRGRVTGLLGMGLQGVCFTRYRSEMVEDRLVTMSTGPAPIKHEAACDLSAWAFAAQGIKLVPDQTNPAIVILRVVD